MTVLHTKGIFHLSPARNAIQRTAWLATFTLVVTAIIPSPARAAGPTERATRPDVRSTCQAARDAAWFERQLRRTEGDNEPLEPAEPAACATASASQPLPNATMNAVRWLASPSRYRTGAPLVTSECEASRRQAWFERELRRTDGDNEPLGPASVAPCAASRPAS